MTTEQQTSHVDEDRPPSPAGDLPTDDPVAREIGSLVTFIREAAQKSIPSKAVGDYEAKLLNRRLEWAKVMFTRFELLSKETETSFEDHYRQAEQKVLESPRRDVIDVVIAHAEHPVMRTVGFLINISGGNPRLREDYVQLMRASALLIQDINPQTADN